MRFEPSLIVSPEQGMKRKGDIELSDATLARETKARWGILVACILAMMAIANLQYGWTLFTSGLSKSMNVKLAAIQVAFTLFVLAQTWGQPVLAYLVDRFGAKLMVSIGGLLVAGSWVGSGLANNLTMLYVAYALGGVGAGITYGACVGMGTKWFPDHRGLVVGLTAGAYGAGTALTVIPISNMIESSGYRATFITIGIIQGIVVLLCAQFMKFPATGWKPYGWEKVKDKILSRTQQTGRDYTPVEMLKTPTFYVLFLMMTLLAFGGLMVTAQMKPLSASYGYDKQILFGTVSVLAFSMIVEQVANGTTRPFWGWISDHIGRYNTMSIAFLIEATGIILLCVFIKTPILFMILSALTYFAWGEIYSLFPSAVADIFGTKFSTSNYGILYMSKGVASILAGPGAALLKDWTGSWIPVLLTGAAFDLFVAGLAIFWMKPKVTKMVAQARAAEAQRAAV